MAIDPLEVTTAITDSYRRYLKTAFRLRDPALAELFHEELGKFQFAKGPILEATPPFKAGCSLSVLATESLLDPLLTDLIYESHPYLKTKPLYLHQERAIRKALRGRNLVISSGTSSGKTECFLIPILNHLVREHREGKLRPGVRALLLYPMNALANDQLRRLRDLGNVFAKHAPDLPITFGRYVGDTAETKKGALERFKKEHGGKDPAPGELLSREEMRASPPHILLTNYAMLEYLLLRPEDCSFFDGEHAQHWKFLVLDEAHTYNGATGIEMGMLIRRLKDRVCGSVPGRLQCIATSATLVSEDADFPKVAAFASNLFGECFKWETPDPKRQDVVKGEREPARVEPQMPFTAPLSLYVELQRARESAKDQSGLRDQFLKICADCGTPEAILTKAAGQGGNAARLLYEILSHDLSLSRLKQFIQKPRTFEQCCKEVFGSNAEPLKCLVDLAAWAKPDDESLPLLPARYHLFVRAPEGAFLSLYPTRKISLERRERTAEGNPVFELASCRRCGQEYLVGRLSQGKLAHSQSDPEVRTKTIRYYLLKSSSAACEEDEDESVALPEDEAGGRAVKLCFKCGTTSEGDQAPSCGCGGDYVQELVEARPKDGVLNKCLLCGLRSIDIVREFVFQQDAPAAVLATALYQKLGKDDPKARKILCFSDSRQDAAFFAPYLGGTYERILYRRLMIEALGQNRGVADYRLESLVEDVFALANKFDLLDPTLDEKQKRKLVWKSVLQEFCALDRRNCLEGVGLVAFVPIRPKAWEPPEDLLHDKLNLSRAEAAAIYHILLNTLRLNMAVTFPEAGPAPNDEAFAPRNQEYKIRGEGSIPASAIYSWVPATGRVNTRLQFLMKLYQPRKGGQEIDSDARKLLGTIWEDLAARWKGQGIDAFHDARHGTLFQLDYRFWRVLHGESATDLYVCDRCGSFSPECVRGVCSTFGCDGKLARIGQAKAQTVVETNHYRHLYKTLSIAKMSVHEHTAQLKQDYATEVQLKFINGDVNVLSCSTTFELGVDLGELETIFMRNVPPEPSNYIQRAGRAGRRTSSAGFTFTFARLRPHDLNYFARPEEIVGGYVKPPAVEIVNEKIVRRHLHAVALSEFWKRFREHFGVVDKFFELGAGDPSSTDGFECFRNFLQKKPEALAEALKRIAPLDMQPVFDMDNWRWVEELFDPNEGPLELAHKAICSEYEQIDDFWRDKKDELQALLSNPGLHSSQRGRLNRDIDWAEKTLQTVKGRKLIDFLATHGVLPKYGFPVDVVELTALHHAPAAKRIQLERDLRIAISEFAPGSQVVANGYLWESAALKVVKAKTWDIFWYAVCPASGCDRFQIKRGTIEEVPPDLTCEACGNNVPRGHIHRMLVPIFGFTTSREVEPIRPGEARPRRDFSTRPYFVSHESRQQCEHSIGQLLVNCEYSARGELAVVCKGKKGQGFKICFDCGYAIATVERTKPSHRTPLGRECSAPLRSPWHLGHSFQTDLLLLSVTTIDHAGMPSLRKDESFWLSFLYSLLEGASEALGIRRRDLDGCLYPKPDRYGLVLFDTVPGGAGHVKRLMDEPNIRATLRASKARLEQTEAHNCGEETSCYGCLRNYDNQFCHDQLRRGPVLRFLRERL